MNILMKSRVKLVEERFQVVMRGGQAYGEAMTETKAAAATEQVSTGWWLVLEGWPVALGLGMREPEFARGDLVEIRIGKVT